MEFLWQEYWSGLPFPSWEDFPDVDWTWVSCFGRQILYRWTTREAPFFFFFPLNKKIMWTKSILAGRISDICLFLFLPRVCVYVCVCVCVFLRWTKATCVHTLKISTLVITLPFNTHVATSWLTSCFKGSAYPVFWDALKMADTLHFGGLFSSLPISGSGPLPACSGSLFLSSGLSFLGLCPSSRIKIGTTLSRLNREHASWLHHNTD